MGKTVVTPVCSSMAQGNKFLTMKIWHGGCFEMEGKSLVYRGRMFRTVAIDPDEMGWFTLVEEAEKSGFKRAVDGIFFMNPDEGLKRAYNDRDAQLMCTLAGLHIVVECYIIPQKDVSQLMHWLEVIDGLSVVNKPTKLMPRRKGDVERASLTAEKGVPFEKKGPHVSSSSFIAQKETALSGQKRASLISEKKSQKTVVKSPKKPSKSSSSVLRTSPRSVSKQKVVEKSSEKTTPSTSKQLKPPNTEKIVPEIHQTFSDQPGPSFDCNDITLADLYNEELFDEHEVRADNAALNCNEEASDLSEGEELDPGYDPEDDIGESDDEDDESEEDDVLLENDLNDTDFHDDELQEARGKRLAWNAKALEIANQVQLEAASGKLTGQKPLSDPNSSRKHDVPLSDYDESGDEEDTPGESDEESIPGKRKSFSIPVVNERTDYLKLKWRVGIRFGNTDLFKEAVIRYAVAQGRDLTFDISDKARGQKLRARCKKGCPFFVYGSWDNKLATFIVKSVDPHHTCHRTMESNRQLKSSWLAKQFLDVFKAKPHWPAKDIIDTVRKAYKVIIKKDLAYKVKYNAHKLLHGSMKEHYSKIGSYIAALEKGNPSSVFTLYTNPNITSNPAVFQRLFVCFDALKQGWLLGCRKLLCVDSCFLKTFLGGQLMAVIGRDGNEQMFPLAWAVVEGENNESYEWFFKQLKSALGEVDGEGWTFISDEHQSILTMIAQEFPRAEHRHCARHIFANWHKTYKGDEMKLLFWNCAKAYNEADFNDALNAIREVDHKAAEAFIACRPHLFCRAFIQTHTKNDVIVNNMAETFNAYIIEARSKHVIYMLEEIRTALMQRLLEKKTEMESSTHVVCPNVQALLELEKDKAAQCKVALSTTTVFQVTHGLDGLTVDLEARTCTCRKWDLTGIPCFHAVAAIFDISAVAEDYVDDMYKREAYLRSYNLPISPCPGQRHWPKVELTLNPPPIKVGPGRPRKKRRRDPHENPKKPGKLTKHGIQMSCSVCKSTAHNKRKCPDKDKVVAPPPKRPMGRPRKSGAPVASGSSEIVSEVHHTATAQPTRIGRGGRVIRTGRGGNARGGNARGRGSSAAARGRGRGRLTRGGRAPQGFGVLFDESGNAYTAGMGNHRGLRNLLFGESTQQSVNQ